MDIRGYRISQEVKVDKEGINKEKGYKVIGEKEVDGEILKVIKHDGKSTKRNSGDEKKDYCGYEYVSIYKDYGEYMGVYKCKRCSMVSYVEENLGDYLDASGIDYLREYEIKKGDKKYRYDFAILTKGTKEKGLVNASNIELLIEINGAHHERPIGITREANERYQQVQESANEKLKYAVENRIPIINIDEKDLDENIRGQIKLRRVTDKTILRGELVNESIRGVIRDYFGYDFN